MSEIGRFVYPVIARSAKRNEAISFADNLRLLRPSGDRSDDPTRASLWINDEQPRRTDHE